jgi:hypothetical protein
LREVKKMNKNKEDLGKKIKNFRINPWLAGAIIGFFAASLQKIASMTKPPAYGFCMACHARDLINSIVNPIAGTELGIAPIITSIPTLTIIGVLIGSFFSAIIFKEFKLSKAKFKVSYFKMFLFGLLVMNFALILSACPIRTSLRVAHGDIIAVAGLFFIGIGAIIGTIFLEQRVKV